MIYPGFVDHLVFRVSQLDKTEQFYTTLLGEPSHRAEDSVMYKTGDTRLFFTSATELSDPQHRKEAIGLNHLAFGVRSLTELETIQAQLDGSKVAHSGICLDRYGMTEFLWLDDPDGMRLEFYLRSL